MGRNPVQNPQSEDLDTDKHMSNKFLQRSRRMIRVYPFENYNDEVISNALYEIYVHKCLKKSQL